MRLAARLIPLFCAINLCAGPVLAQDVVDDDVVDTAARTDAPAIEQKAFYWSNGLDMAIFSTSSFDKPGDNDALTPLRFTYFINFGFNLNHDFTNNFGAFTGVGIKNIGFIEKFPALDSTVKRRVYTLGVPLGIKIGNLGKRNFVMLGAGADLAFHYKEKGFIRRGNKDKTREWFSDRTPLIMPHVFLGASFAPGITVKAQYYFNNFLNTDYTQKIPGGTIGGITYPPFYYKPYTGYDVHLILLSFGFDIHYKKVKVIAGKDDDDKKTM